MSQYSFIDSEIEKKENRLQMNEHTISNLELVEVSVQ